MTLRYTDNNVDSNSIPPVTPSRTKRLRRTPEEARRLILETAQALITSTGPEGLRLQDIAAAGISHPLTLHYFGSREGLVRALTRQAVAELRDKLVAAMASGDCTVEQQLDRVFDTFRDGLAQRWFGSPRSIPAVERREPGWSCSTSPISCISAASPHCPRVWRSPATIPMR
jgi:AcrR family transcriptional regulator